jgi:hypothetical protein
MRFVTLREMLELHRRVLEQSQGLFGIRDLGGCNLLSLSRA